MRRRTCIAIRDADIDVLQELNEYFLNQGMDAVYTLSGVLKVRLYADTLEFTVLMDELRKRGLEYGYSEVREYTKKELEEAKLFQMVLPFPYEMDGEIPNYGTTYEESCSDCNVGLIQTSDLIVNVKKFSKYDIATLMPEILISERVRLLLEENEITGYTLRPVTDFKRRTDTLLYQLVITNTLPEMSSQIRTEVSYFRGNKKFKPYPCKICGRNGKIRRSEAIYEKAKLTKVSDFNLSDEYFGINMYCVQDIIVTQKLRKVFKENKISRIIFDPVSII